MTAGEATGDYAEIAGARLFYVDAGFGTPVVMIHAGVADSRQWAREADVFARRYRVVRYDMRGFGKSEPVDGEYRNLDDLVALLDHLGVREPAILMACSMGGGLAIDLALAHPDRVQALVLVERRPAELELDAPAPELFAEAEAAYNAGDLDRLCELEMRVWFDGMGRTPIDVNPATRALAYEMDRLVLAHHARGLGERLPDTETPAAARLAALTVPVLVVVGQHDVPYLHAAADHMVAHLPDAEKLLLADAAHLANMQQPVAFEDGVRAFLEAHGLGGTDVSALSRTLHPMDEDVAAALSARRLWAAYRARPAYQQNDYIGWINRAKRPETKQRRLDQMLDELARGDAYMKMAWRGRARYDGLSPRTPRSRAR